MLASNIYCLPLRQCVKRKAQSQTTCLRITFYALRSRRDVAEPASCAGLESGRHDIGRVGFEPTRPRGQRILSPRRLPFRHRPVYATGSLNGLPVSQGAIFRRRRPESNRRIRVLQTPALPLGYVAQSLKILPRILSIRKSYHRLFDRPHRTSIIPCMPLGRLD